jgi:hypothetical protein
MVAAVNPTGIGPQPADSRFPISKNLKSLSDFARKFAERAFLKQIDASLHTPLGK